MRKKGRRHRKKWFLNKSISSLFHFGCKTLTLSLFSLSPSLVHLSKQKLSEAKRKPPFPPLISFLFIFSPLKWHFFKVKSPPLQREEKQGSLHTREKKKKKKRLNHSFTPPRGTRKKISKDDMGEGRRKLSPSDFVFTAHNSKASSIEDSCGVTIEH